LLAGGTEEQRERWLPRFATGEAQGCFAITERGAGNDVGGIRLAARRDGEDWVLDGEKWFVGNAVRADVFLVIATTDPDARASGAALFLVPAATTGIEVGPPIEKMGLRGATHSPVAFGGVRVPAENVLAHGREAFRLLMRTIDVGRPLTSAACLGIARAALAESVAYARRRETFGRPIATRQAVQRLIATMAVDIEAGAALTFGVADDVDAGWDDFFAHKGPTEASTKAAMAKLYTSRMVSRVCSDAVQIHGARGYLTGEKVERLFRDARAAEIYEGTSEIQELIIGRELLGQR
jgi:acyl-CoA dehydrogenase